MEVLDAIRTRLEVNEFDGRHVPEEVKREILDAARLAPSAMNRQRWRFVLLDSPESLKKLAEISTTGQWISRADFAIVVLIDSKDRFGMFDAGKAITHMQLAAWTKGVGSRNYTGYDETKVKELIGAPAEMAVAAVVGFGYPAKKIIGRKNRLPLEQVAFHERFGKSIDEEKRVAAR
jgi:nitroreductase